MSDNLVNDVGYALLGFDWSIDGDDRAALFWRTYHGEMRFVVKGDGDTKTIREP